MAISRPLPYYRWYVNDHRANRHLQRMGYVARGFHRELLDEQWIEGSLPKDLSILADICRCPLRVMEKAWIELAPLFEEDERGRLINGSLEGLRTADDQIRIKRVEAGRLGGIAKQVPAGSKQVLADAKQVPYSRAEESRAGEIIKDNISSSSDFALESESESPAPKKKPAAKFTEEDCERIYQAYPKKVGKLAALKEIRAALEQTTNDNPAEVMLALVREFAESPAGQLGQFVPDPERWFKKGKYDDDPKVWQETSGGVR